MHIPWTIERKYNIAAKAVAPKKRVSMDVVNDNRLATLANDEYYEPQYCLSIDTVDYKVLSTLPIDGIVNDNRLATLANDRYYEPQYCLSIDTVDHNGTSTLSIDRYCLRQ